MKKKEKVTLYFKGGNQMTFKCKSFTLRRSNEEGPYYSSATIEKIDGDVKNLISFDVREVVGVKIKKVLF